MQPSSSISSPAGAEVADASVAWPAASVAAAAAAAVSSAAFASAAALSLMRALTRNRQVFQPVGNATIAATSDNHRNLTQLLLSPVLPSLLWPAESWPP